MHGKVQILLDAISVVLTQRHAALLLLPPALEEHSLRVCKSATSVMNSLLKPGLEPEYCFSWPIDVIYQL